MSQLSVPFDGRVVVFGFDRPFDTFFAQLWLAAEYARPFGAPLRVTGYHPVEQQIPPLAGEYGPYPLDLAGLESELARWEVPSHVRGRVRRMLLAELL